jgi:hypothetical protein
MEDDDDDQPIIIAEAAAKFAKVAVGAEGRLAGGSLGVANA